MAMPTLYGVGVGPGDPKLMTIRAGEVVRAADVISYPVNGSGEGRARAIAASIIPADVEELPIHIPMRVEREPAREAYGEAADLISDRLDEGKSVAWLCVGDPLFYGTFIYLAARLGDAHPIEIVPGVTSLSACAARTHTALAGRTDVLSVVPATLEEDTLRMAIETADAAVIIKVGRHFEKVRAILHALGLANGATILEGASGPGERVMPLNEVAEGERPYFSTILVRRGEVS